MAPKIPTNFLTNTELGVSVIAAIKERQLLEVGLASVMGGGIVAAIVEGNIDKVEHIPDAIKKMLIGPIGGFEQTIGAPIFQSFIQSALGINLSDTVGQEAQAVRMVERAIGFGAGLPAILSLPIGLLESKFGHHAPRGMIQALKEIPHDIGMSFFLGTTLASIFEIATSGPIGEAIREQTRPARFEWREIARLLKAHELTEAEATDRLAKAGFRTSDIDLAKRLGRQLITIAELQTIHEIGWWDDGVIRDYLDTLGLEPVDRDAVMQIIAHKSATEGATSFRTIARNAYLSSYLGEDTYRALLKQSETPHESIDLLVAGVKLERDAGRLHLSIAEIKDLYQHNHIDGNEVRQRLAIRGMSDGDIADLLVVWADEKRVGRSGIGTSRILGYLLGGVIDKTKAYNLLVESGMRQSDAQFLADHPSTHPQTIKKDASQGTIIAAYKDDVLTIDEARARLKRLNLTDAAIELLLANAVAQVTKGKKPRKPTKTLSESNVLEALKLGLATSTWAERELETLGWAAADASLLVMVEMTKLDPRAPDQLGWAVLN